MSHHPSIQDLARQYADVGISKRDAVRYIVDSRMKARAPRGKGNRAAKRAALAETARWFDELPQLSEADVQAIYADVQDNALEARTRRHAQAFNFQE